MDGFTERVKPRPFRGRTSRCENSRHHRAVHEEGYQVDRQPDGVLQFRRPDGKLLPDVPAPAAVPADPVQALRAQHDAQGLRLHARTACPFWLGERLDLGYALDVLHPLANRLPGSSRREDSPPSTG
jgi:hypothetical protein